MTALERVPASLRFEESDRLPYRHQGVASKLTSAVLGRKAHTDGRFRGLQAAIAGPDAPAGNPPTRTGIENHGRVALLRHDDHAHALDIRPEKRPSHSPMRVLRL